MGCLGKLCAVQQERSNTKGKGQDKIFQMGGWMD